MYISRHFDCLIDVFEMNVLIYALNCNVWSWTLCFMMNINFTPVSLILKQYF